MENKYSQTVPKPPTGPNIEPRRAEVALVASKAPKGNPKPPEPLIPPSAPAPHLLHSGATPADSPGSKPSGEIIGTGEIVVGNYWAISLDLWGT